MSLRASKPKGLKWDRQNQLWLEVPERYRLSVLISSFLQHPPKVGGFIGHFF